MAWDDGCIAYVVLAMVILWIKNFYRRGFQLKAHIVVSEDALPQGKLRKALCGENVPHAVFVSWIQSSQPQAFFKESLRGICRKCVEQIKPQADRVKRYFYLVVTGEESFRDNRINE